MNSATFKLDWIWKEMVKEFSSILPILVNLIYYYQDKNKELEYKKIKLINSGKFILDNGI